MTEIEEQVVVEEHGAASARRIARNVVFRSGGELVAKLGSVVFFISIARVLGTTQFGDFTFALSLTGSLILVSGLGTDNLLTREVARDQSHLSRYLGNVVALKVVTSLVLLGVAAAVVTFGGYDSHTRYAVYLVGAGVAVENLSRTWYAAFQAYERAGYISISLTVQRLVTAAAGFIVLALDGGLVAVGIVYLAGSVVGLACATWAFRRFVGIPRWVVEPARLLPLLRAAVPIGIASLLFTILLRADATLLSFLEHGDNTEVGLYGAAFRLIEATMFISWSFGAAMLPWLARQSLESAERLARGYEVGLKAMTAVLAPVGVVLMVLAPQIVHLVYGHGYGGAILPLRLVGAMTVLYGINYLTSTMLTAHDRPLLFARLFAVVVLQNVVENLILIPPYGATGAAISATTSGVLLALLSLRQARKHVGEVRVARAFAGPAAAAVAMALALLAADLPLAPALALGAVVYLVALAVFERAVYPDDVVRLTRVLRAGRGPRPAVAGD